MSSKCYKKLQFSYFEYLIFDIQELIGINVFAQFIQPIWSFVGVHLICLKLEMHPLQNWYVVAWIVQYYSCLLLQKVGLIGKSEVENVVWVYQNWSLVPGLKILVFHYKRPEVLYQGIIVFYHYGLNTVKGRWSWVTILLP